MKSSAPNSMQGGLLIEAAFQKTADRFYREAGFRVNRPQYDNPYGRELQKIGYDVILHNNQTSYTVSEKFRTHDWGDMLVEFASGKDEGWIFKEIPSVIHYFVVDDAEDPENQNLKCYIINRAQLAAYVERMLTSTRLLHGGDWSALLANHQNFETNGLKFYAIPTEVNGKVAYWGWCVALDWEDLRKAGVKFDVIENIEYIG